MRDEVVATYLQRFQEQFPYAVEQALSRTDDNRRDVQPQLVDQPSRQVLAHNIGSTGDSNSSAAHHLASVPERRSHQEKSSGRL